MAIITCDDWTFDADYKRAWAPTNNPRIRAVIERDDSTTFRDQLDGDAIPPVFSIDRDVVSHEGGYMEDEDIAARIVEALNRFRYAAGYRYDGLSHGHIAKSEAMLARWAWVFHGVALNRGNYGYQGQYDMLILSTPAYREHLSIGEYAPARIQTMDEVRVEAQATVDGMSATVADIADGEVYGIGYATLDALPEDMADEPTMDDFEVSIECWGFVGEDYAKASAAAFEAGEPTLPELLEVA
jgi:hypothetical protein